MSKGNKILIGIFTFLPFVLLILFLVSFFQAIFKYIPDLNDTTRTIIQPNPKEVFETIAPFFIYIGLMSLIALGLLIFYIIHAVNNKGIDSTERVVWILLFVFVGLIAFPVYYIVRIVKEAPKPEAIV